jgi:hypothetical protein
MSFPLPALACPPGSWFCAEAEVNVPAPPQAQAPRIPPQAAPPPAEEQEAPAPPPARFRPPPPQAYAPPPVVIYQPVPSAPPTRVIVITPGYGYGYGQGYAQPYAPRPPMIAPPRVPRWQSEWGLNLRVEGMGINKPGASTFAAGLGGVGLSLRYRPVPHFAFDMGVDVLAGTDWNGFQRTEVPVSLSGMIFVNPRSRAQFYLLFGGNVSRAQVHGDPATSTPAGGGNGGYYGPSDARQSYTYAGGQAGGGFEFRLSRHVALDLDVVGFIRKRIDGGDGTPEFTDPSTGQTTDVSGGALGRGGLTFWW